MIAVSPTVNPALPSVSIYNVRRTFARPGSPTFCTPLLLLSYHTKSPIAPGRLAVQ